MVDKNETHDIYENFNISVQLESVIFDIFIDTGFKTMLLNNSAFCEKHSHSFFEAHFITKGEGILYIDNDKQLVPASSYYIIAPGIYHSFYQNPANPVSKHYMKFNYKLAKDNQKNQLSQESNAIINALSGFKYHCAKDSHNNISLIHEIQRAIEEKPFLYYSKIQCLFMKVIINLISSIPPAIKKSNVPPLMEKDKKLSATIEQYLYNYCNKLTIKDLASLLNISKRQLNRVMLKLYNSTFKQLLINTRIEVSKDLLRNTDHTIEAIAGKVGYANLRNFSTIFKKNTGMTPKAFRSKYKHI